MSKEILAFLSMPSGGEWIFAFLILLLLFGKRVPEIAKSLGQGILEFKKGLHGLEEPANRAIPGAIPPQPGPDKPA